LAFLVVVFFGFLVVFFGFLVVFLDFLVVYLAFGGCLLPPLPP